MKTKQLRALLVAGLLSLTPVITLTSCGGGGGGGGGGGKQNSQNTAFPNENGDGEDSDSPQATEPKDYAPDTLKPCKIEFAGDNGTVFLYSNGARVWYSINNCYSDGYWNYTKTGVNKGYLTVTDCENQVTLYSWLKLSLRGEITFDEDNKAHWDFTQVIVNSNGRVNSISRNVSCTITSLSQ